MIRTRDLLLYVLVVVFLVIAVVATWHQSTKKHSPQVTYENAQLSAPVIPALKNQIVVDERVAVVDRLKTKIARGEGYDEDRPPVFTSVDTVVVEEASEVRFCRGRSGLGSELVRLVSGPLEMTVEGSTRVFTAESGQMIFQLPLYPQRTTQPICANQVAGIAVDGTVLYNNNTDILRSASQYQLIGYALDGHSIYGPVTDSGALDDCGGRTTAAGYTYHVPKDKEKILTCFTSEPLEL